MEKQFKIFGFVIILAVLGVGIFGFVQTKDLKKKLEVAEKSMEEKSTEVSSLITISNDQNRKIASMSQIIRQLQDAENVRQSQAAQAAQAKAEEEAAKKEKEKEKEAAKAKADAAEKEKKASQPAAAKPVAAKPGSAVAKPGAKKPVAKKPAPPKKKTH